MDNVTAATSLAQWSNVFIYASMFVLTIAMISFAVSFASGRKAIPAQAADAAQTDVTVAEVNGSVAVVTRTVVTNDGDPTVRPGRRSGNIGLALTWLAFLSLLVGVVLRGVWAGRVPWGNMYEFSITSALGILAVFLILSLRRDVRWLGMIITTLTLLTLGLAVTVLYSEAAQLVPALKSYWLVIHVSCAIICGGAFTVSGSATILYLIRLRAEGRAEGKPVTGFAGMLPTSESLDSLAYKIIAFSFPIWTFAVVSGAIWAESAWGRYWGWDPKETWAFITWVVYAGYLHARATAGWRGSRAAWISLLGFTCFLINYFGINLFVNGLHSYAGVG